MTGRLDETDRLIINRLQEGLPLTRHPYAAAAEEIGIEEADLLDRLKRLLGAGYLSRFGPMFNADRMGGGFCLCALAVPTDRFEAVLEIVNRYPEVAHNYQREHAYNMWFVIACPDWADIDKTILSIEEATGLPVLALPKEEEYFVGLRVAA